MALDPRWPLALFRGAVPVALGLLLWVAIAGGEEERQKTLRAQPGADAAISAQRQHNKLIMAALREAAETDENVAQRRVPWRK